MTTPIPPTKTRSRFPVRVLAGLAFVWLVIGVSSVGAGHMSRTQAILWAVGFAALLLVKGLLDIRSRR